MDHRGVYVCQQLHLLQTEASIAALYTDNCSTVTATLLSSSVTGTNCSWTATYTYSIKDACDNEADNAVVIYTGGDTEPPVLSSQPENVVVSCDAIPAEPVITAFDNCAGAVEVSYSSTNTQGSDPSVCDYYSYTIFRTWSAVDGCNNSTSYTQTIEVKDQTAPAIIAGTIPGCYSGTSITVAKNNALRDALFATIYSDNCVADEYLIVTRRIEGSCNAVIWVIVEDPCGNDDSISYNTTIDVTPPTFTRPVDIVIYSAADCSYDASVAITGDVNNEADNCAVGLQATYNDVVVDGLCQGSRILTRTWSLVDGCGNQAADQVQTITITDHTAPSLSSEPEDVIVSCDAIPEIPTITATDNCSGSAEVTFSSISTQGTDPALCTYYSYEIKRTWNATDVCGNLSFIYTNHYRTGSNCTNSDSRYYCILFHRR